MFCACAVPHPDAAPNTHTCPVCLGLPGTLPTINRRAVEHVLATGAAIGATAPATTRWDRKNYFYPDLPKGYQISQYDLPLAAEWLAHVRHLRGAGHDRDHAGPPRGGHGEAGPRGRPRRGPREPRGLQPLQRAAHGDRHRARHPDRRAGSPLRRGAPAPAPRDRRLRCGDGERPDAGGGERLAAPPRHGAVRDPDRGQEHELVPRGGARGRLRDRAPGGRARRRRDAPPGDAGLGRREGRHLPDAGEGGSSDDYRYFPEPDLPPLHLDAEWLAGIRAALPELPAARRARYRDELGLSPTTRPSSSRTRR